MKIIFCQDEPSDNMSQHANIQNPLALQQQNSCMGEFQALPESEAKPKKFAKRSFGGRWSPFTGDQTAETGIVGEMTKLIGKPRE